MNEFFKQPVILATDGSRAAAAAGDAAVQIALASGAPLHLVHAWTDIPTLLPTVPALGLGSWASDLQADARRVLDTEQQRVIASGVPQVSIHLQMGRPVDAISALADDLDAGLVVVGSRGAGLVPRLLLGSVSEGLVHSSNRPVLVVRSEPAGWPPKSMLAGDDGSEAAAAAGAMAAALASLLKLPLKVMMAYPPRLAATMGLPASARGLLAQMEADLERRARALKATATAMRPGDPAEAILAEAGGPEALVVVGSHLAGALARVALGSVSTAVLHAHRGPVLVVPGRRPA